MENAFTSTQTRQTVVSFVAFKYDLFVTDVVEAVDTLVQGSGKSHTLSCILENALISSSRIGALPEPLAALVCVVCSLMLIGDADRMIAFISINRSVGAHVRRPS